MMRMSASSSFNALLNPVAFQTPDCIRCLRRKLKAVGVASFFLKDGVWVLSDYEDSLPSADAEFRVCYMLKLNMPQIVADTENGMILNTARDLAKVVPRVNHLFDDCALIGVRTVFAGLGGVRIAWRQNDEPFTQEELDVLACFGDCPKDCGVDG